MNPNPQMYYSINTGSIGLGSEKGKKLYQDKNGRLEVEKFDGSFEVEVYIFKNTSTLNPNLYDRVEVFAHAPEYMIKKLLSGEIKISAMVRPILDVNGNPQFTEKKELICEEIT